MDLSVLLFLTSGLFLGWSLGANDAANVFGTAVGTRMVSFATAAVVCSIFVVLGAVVSGAGAAHTLGKLGSVNALAGSFMAALAAALTVYTMTKWGLPVSTTQAIVGAIIGWNLFSGSITDSSALIKIVGTWIACPLLAGLIAVPIFKLVEHFIHVLKLHLLRQDAYMRVALILAGAFGAYSLGANNIANVMGVFVPVSPFTEFEIAHLFTLSSVQQLFLLGSVAIAVGVFTYSKRVMLTVGQNLLPLSPVGAWVVVIAHSIVLFVFASEGLEHLLASAGLPTIPLVPVSSSQAVVGAVLGLGIMRGGRNIRWRVVAGIGAGWVTTPIISAAVCFVALFFLQNVFNQQVYKPVRYAVTPPVVHELASFGIVPERLAPVQGKRYDSGAKFLAALGEAGEFSSKEKQALISHAEIHDMIIDPALVAKLDATWLSVAQMSAIESLAGRGYRYKWRLAKALADISDEWKRLDDIPVNKVHNKGIARKLEYLYRTFSVEP